MKKYMLLVVIGIVLSSCATASSGTSPTVKEVKTDLFGVDHSFDYSNVVLKNYEPTQFADLSEVLYFGYIAKPKATEVKLGKLNNKVNIFHLFYRCKV